MTASGLDKARIRVTPRSTISEPMVSIGRRWCVGQRRSLIVTKHGKPVARVRWSLARCGARCPGACGRVTPERRPAPDAPRPTGRACRGGRAAAPHRTQDAPRHPALATPLPRQQQLLPGAQRRRPARHPPLGAIVDAGEEQQQFARVVGAPLPELGWARGGDEHGRRATPAPDALALREARPDRHQPPTMRDGRAPERSHATKKVVGHVADAKPGAGNESFCRGVLSVEARNPRRWSTSPAGICPGWCVITTRTPRSDPDVCLTRPAPVSSGGGESFSRPRVERGDRGRVAGRVPHRAARPDPDARGEYGLMAAAPWLAADIPCGHPDRPA